MDEVFGVIDANKTYDHHAIARVLGVTDSKGECSKFVLRNLLHQGLPFRKVGRRYMISGHVFNLWIQQGSAPWEAWTDDTKSSSAEGGDDSSSATGTTTKRTGARKRST